MKRSIRYRLDSAIRALAMQVMSWLTPTASAQPINLQRNEIKKILLVRSVFRMGDSLLATPAILIFRKNFPHARVDFVGSSIAKLLYENLPINHHYAVYRGFPKVCWSYMALLKEIRLANYDLAVDVSGSSAALGSFIVGFSAARFRIGIKGKWDQWFNVRLARPATHNKYSNLPELLGFLGLATEQCLPSLVLSHIEAEQGRRRIEDLVGCDQSFIVGIFVGGRKTRGKRWPRENFLELAVALHAEGVRIIIFVGPEERELLAYFEEGSRRIPVVFEPNVRSFASMVASCNLFVTCDSGPLHLACAMQVKTIAIFLQRNFDRWGPPRFLAKIIYRETTATTMDVLEACRRELKQLSMNYRFDPHPLHSSQQTGAEIL
jgi:ADP-heptose:LPS heptosyltransferase